MKKTLMVVTLTLVALSSSYATPSGAGCRGDFWQIRHQIARYNVVQTINGIVVGAVAGPVITLGHWCDAKGQGYDGTREGVYKLNWEKGDWRHTLKAIPS